MLKSYEAIYENGKLKWVGASPTINKAKVIVVIEDIPEVTAQHSIKQLKGIAPKFDRTVSLEEMNSRG